MIEKTCVLRNQAAETHGHYFLMVLTHETSVAAFLNINHSIRSKAPWSSELNQMIQDLGLLRLSLLLQLLSTSFSYK